ncbi:MAG: hypothetical protein V3U35_08015 [Candidatus Neomarinimicrobiota bacterium]
MRYLAPILIVVLVFAIMVGGSYDRQDVAQASLQLVPTSLAQPELIEATIGEVNGIRALKFSRSDQQLLITYDTGRVSLADVNHMLLSLGYRAVPLGPTKVSAGM